MNYLDNISFEKLKEFPKAQPEHIIGLENFIAEYNLDVRDCNKTVQLIFIAPNGRVANISYSQSKEVAWAIIDILKEQLNID